MQAGAVSGGSPSYLGRDNANQITLNDGISPITNQYLFQPIAAAFYSPCVDGDMDTSVFGHEYTHLISNRMVAGPDSGLVGLQAGAMGESWSDLDAVEYLHENGYVPTDGENPFAVGAYATGNKDGGDPRLRDQRQPAQLQRHRLRHRRAGGPRRRRGLERRQLHDPAGARRQVRRDVPRGTPAAARRTARPASTPPTRARATGGGSRSSTTPGC